MTNLNIGCGTNVLHLENWINCDINSGKNIVYLDATKKFDFDNNSIDNILCEHLIEHLDYEGQKNLLSESYRVLKPGGVLRIICPHIDFLVELYLHPENHRDYIYWWMHAFVENKNCDNYCYTGLLDDLDDNDIDVSYIFNLFMKKWGHTLVHSKKSLLQLFSKYNFYIEESTPDNSKYEVFKNVEGHSRDIGYNFNHLESIAYDLVKIKYKQ